ncbi:cupin domain-containing protein [Natronospora cellulosivora (SeqCode)]
MKISVEKASEEKLNQLGVRDWPIWEKEVSEFPWHYDSKEVCFILEGKVIVETDDEKVEIKTGDLVAFPAGLDCRWNILKDIKKHYKFY